MVKVSSEYMVKVAINGFGRIGRTAFKAMLLRKNIEVVAINDLTDNATLGHLLMHDSVYGAFSGTVEAKKDSLVVNGKKIAAMAEKAPEKLPWKKLGVDIVLESTGVFRKKQDAEKHLKAGAKRVLMSAPPKNGAVKQFVLGVNEATYDPKADKVVSMASCTTNCLAPLAKVLHDNFTIQQGFMTTVHAYTADQNLVDAPHRDLRRARAAAINIVPTTTGAATAVMEVIPELKGKLDGIAMRVPVPTGSVTDFVAVLEKKVNAQAVNAAMYKAAQGAMKGVLQYSDDELVSSDIIGNPYSCIFDSKQTKVMGNLVKVVAWYDNEWGYSSRLPEFILYMAKAGL